MASTMATVGEQSADQLRREYATVGEAARFLCLSRAMVYRLMDERELASAKFGSARRIPIAALREYAARQTVSAN
jgi:excisionase family DNA binding protein